MFIIPWSFCIIGFYYFGYVASFFYSPLRPFYKGRGYLLKNLKTAHQSNQRFLFFCSSAGEYEQATPLMKRLEDLGGDIFICFFSPSGMKHALAKKESRFIFLSPADSLWHWKRVFTIIKPTATFVVRHELWPAFLFVGKYYFGNRLILINASNNKKKLSFISFTLKKVLIRGFLQVYVVAQSDFHFFTKKLGCHNSIYISGDSKYDSVFERAQLKKRDAETFKNLLSTCDNITSRLIIGSGWPKDVSIALEALRQLKTKRNQNDLQLIIALHQPSNKAIKELIEACKSSCLTYLMLSDFLDHKSLSQFTTDIIIVDFIGRLSELYHCADLAFIGGALHYQVHNVLEPACYGLPLAFGPYFTNSREAVQLVEGRCARVITRSVDLAQWWTEQMETEYVDGQMVKKLVSKHLGATDTILSTLSAEQILYDREATHY